jgi:hypothetical protein
MRHGAQAVLLAAALQDSDSQAVQLRFSVAVGMFATYVPGWQSVRATQAVAGLWSWSQVPAAQGRLGAVPPAQYSPAVHGAHVPPEAGAVPGRQPPARQMDSFGELVLVPAAHARQTRSAEAEGVFAT